MKTLAPGALAALASPALGLVTLIEMQFVQATVYLNTSRIDLTWNGKTYDGAALIGAVSPIEDSTGEVKGAQFQLSGVPIEMISLALQEPIQGRPVIISTAILDHNTAAILDVTIDWVGTLDVMSIEEGPGSAAISVSAENVGIDFLRARTYRFTDQDQRAEHPNDRGFEFVLDQSDQQIIWPAASFFKRA